VNQAKLPQLCRGFLKFCLFFNTRDTSSRTLVQLSPGEKGRNGAFNLLNLNGQSLQRITAYLFSTVLRSSSNLQKILSQTAFYAYLDDISLQRAARANLRADLSLSGGAHSFGRTAVQSHTQVSSDDSEAHFDPKPTNSAAGPVPALESVEASGRLARALQ